MLVIAENIKEFQGAESSGNISFVDINSTVKYINLTTAKIKNATITMAGFVNLTENMTFEDSINTNTYIGWNGSLFAKPEQGQDCFFDYEFYTFELNGSGRVSGPDGVGGNIVDRFNFSFYNTGDPGSGCGNSNEDVLSIVFNHSELWVVNKTFNNDDVDTFKLIKTDFPNNPINNIAEFDLPKDASSTQRFAMTFIADDVLVMQIGSRLAVKINMSNNQVFENLTFDNNPLDKIIVGGLAFDNTSLWISGSTGDSPFIKENWRMQPSNFSALPDFRGPRGGDTLRMFYAKNDLYVPENNRDIIKYFGRGFPLGLTINVGNDSTVEYVNITENRKTITTIDFGAASFNNYVIDSCTESKFAKTCEVPIIFNSTSGEWAFDIINITQNNVPNATNLSIIVLPAVAEVALIGHANMTDTGGDDDTFGGKETIWFINKTEINTTANQSILGAGNVTELANITFSARVNDTYDWSIYVNSTTITVGDSTPPVITNISTQNKTSFTTSEKVNITAIVIDGVGTVASVIATTNISGVHTNHTMNLLEGDTYEFAATFGAGNYNIPFVYGTDGSGNRQITESNLQFTVSSPSTTTGGGGGGGGGLQAAIIINETIIRAVVCNNDNVCDAIDGEDFLNCNNDCKFEFGAINPFCINDPTQQCIIKFGFIARAIFVLMLIFFVFLAVIDEPTLNKIKKSVKKFNIEKLKRKVKL